VLHGIEISIRQLTGNRRGIPATEPLDVIYASREGNRSKLGYVARFDNATVVLIRYLPADEREPLRKEVERLRLEQGGCSISKRIASVPNPKLIKAYVKGDLKKKAPTTIVMPDGTPAGHYEDTTSEDDWDE